MLNGAASGDRGAGIRAARDLIYKGEIAHEIADFHAQEGGLLTYEDLATFAVRVEPPTHISYKGYDVYTCGPWCQGPTLNMALKILEGTDLQGMGHESTDYLHTVIEGLKLAFADREAYFGDPDFVQVPMAGLLDERYAAERRGAIDPQRATPDMPLPGDPWRFHPEPRRENGPYPTLDPNRVQPERISHWESDTSYLCVVDEQGNAFSATPSDVVGWSPIVPGLGFPVSGRGTQIWLDPAHPPVCSRGNVHASRQTQRWLSKMESRSCPSAAPAAMRRCKGCCRCSLISSSSGWSRKRRSKHPASSVTVFRTRSGPTDHCPAR